MTSPNPLKWPLKEELDAHDTRALEQRLAVQIQQRSLERRPLARQGATWAMAAAACVVLAFSGYWLIPGDDADGALLLKGGGNFATLSAPAGSEPRRVSFVDGSFIEVEAGGQVRALGSNGRKMLSLLEQGKATFEVVPGGQRQWTVEAGELSVEVLGTRFSVERSQDRVEVEVLRGSVLVRSARIENGVRRLDAGSSIAVGASPKGHPKVVEQHAQPGQDPEEAPVVSLDDLETGQTDDPHPAQTTPSTKTSEALTSAKEWMRIADEARLVGDTVQAVSALESLLRHYPTDPGAPTARFQLARLYLTQGRIAEAKKTLAISAKTTGPLSEDAYFRLIELEQQQGADNEARKLAAEYLRRYPEGRHRAFMESLIK